MSVNLAWAGTAHIHTQSFVKEALQRGFACAGVWDHDAERARHSAHQLGGQVKTMPELADDKSVSGYVICSETVYHLDLVGQIVGAGKPVFIEKPMGFDAKQSRAMSKLLDEHRITFQTGYAMRGQAKNRALKTKVDEGFFGNITRIRASCCHNGALGGWFDKEWRWMADRRLAGVDGFGDLGTHMIDQVMWMFGPVKAVTGAMADGSRRYPDCQELGEAMLKFSSGVIGTVAASWDDIADPIRIQVMGTKGHALLGDDLMLAGEDGAFKKAEVGENATAGFNAFLDHLEGNPAELVTADEATARDIVMDAIYRGAASQSWVEIG